ncbi:uncharacterized protein DS421_8g228970 [Arachis hypogaea]|nr:uncharacterized protein DS421_8g228970 [Arachis hypogaea]
MLIIIIMKANHTLTPIPFMNLDFKKFGLNWRVVLATVIGFLGFAFGTVGGVGGGGIFVLMLTLLIGFDTKSVALYLIYAFLCFQFSIAFVVFGYEIVKLYKDHKKRITTLCLDYICEVSISWTPMNLAFCALYEIIGGIIGGLLGFGGGFVLRTSSVGDWCYPSDN